MSWVCMCASIGEDCSAKDHPSSAVTMSTTTKCECRTGWLRTLDGISSQTLEKSKRILRLLLDMQVGAGVNFKLLSNSLTFECRNPQLPERTGVRVLCLGALNKAESINGGGDGVVKALGPNRRISLIHGNHLTAAGRCWCGLRTAKKFTNFRTSKPATSTAVVQTVHQVFAGHKRVKLFLTGASSKVGWAVARALRDRYGYELLCHSTDSGRSVLVFILL